MSRLGLRRAGALVSLWLLSGHAYAQLAEWAPEAEATAAAPAPDAEQEKTPDAPEGRDWLRPDKPQVTVAGTDDGPGWAPALAFLLVAGLAGGAVFLKMGKKRGPAAVATGLRVVTQTRVGAKASVVALDVGGGVMLLGVTEQQISNLGWLGDAEAAPSEPRERRGAATPGPLLDPNSRHFSQMLNSALRRPADDEDDDQDAASVLARRTEDVLSREGIGTRVEAQVAGLNRRRR